MLIKDHNKHKRLIRISDLARAAGFSAAYLSKLAQADKIPTVKIHESRYGSHELLDRGLIELSKTDPDLLNDTARAYVYKITHNHSHLKMVLESFGDSEDADRSGYVDQEEGIIAGWMRSIDAEYRELADYLKRSVRAARRAESDKPRKTIRRLKRTAFFISDKSGNARQGTIGNLSLRPYAFRLALITVIVFSASVLLVRFHPRLADIIVSANDNIFYTQTGLVEKIFFSRQGEESTIDIIGIIPRRDQLAGFIRRNSARLESASPERERKYLISAEEIFGQVAGASERSD